MYEENLNDFFVNFLNDFFVNFLHPNGINPSTSFQEKDECHIKAEDVHRLPPPPNLHGCSRIQYTFNIDILWKLVA